ncbi:MAG: sulfotransferase [Candidatus Igneacidithiobacillus chanchocoensis]
MSAKLEVRTAHDIWPNFFIVGTVKGGTTSLYRYLQGHPQVFLPDFKEPHFFSRMVPVKERLHLVEFVDNEEEYLQLYQTAKDCQAIGDASTSNLWCSEAAQRIYQKIPDAKIIILLRDPIARAHSHYLMDYREGVNNKDFTVKMLEEDFCCARKGFGISYLYIDLGLYYEQVNRYIETFGKDNELVLPSRELFEDPQTIVKQVASFLKIDAAAFNPEVFDTAHNSFKAPRGAWSRRVAGHPWARWIGYHLLSRRLQWWLYQHLILKAADKPKIDPEVQHYLKEIFDPDITKLEHLLGKKIPSLRDSW